MVLALIVVVAGVVVDSRRRDIWPTGPEGVAMAQMGFHCARGDGDRVGRMLLRPRPMANLDAILVLRGASGVLILRGRRGRPRERRRAEDGERDEQRGRHGEPGQEPPFRAIWALLHRLSTSQESGCTKDRRASAPKLAFPSPARLPERLGGARGRIRRPGGDEE